MLWHVSCGSSCDGGAGLLAVVAEAYEAQTTITKAMLPLLKNLVLLGVFEFMRHRFQETRSAPLAGSL